MEAAWKCTALACTLHGSGMEVAWNEHGTSFATAATPPPSREPRIHFTTTAAAAVATATALVETTTITTTTTAASRPASTSPSENDESTPRDVRGRGKGRSDERGWDVLGMVGLLG